MNATKLKPPFVSWRTMLDRYATTAKVGKHTPPGQYTDLSNWFFGGVQFDLESGGRPEQWAALSRGVHAERMWHDYGRPYYKVWPSLTDALAHTSMNFSAEHFRTPYPAFNVQLPDGETFLVAHLSLENTMHVREGVESHPSPPEWMRAELALQEKLEDRYGPVTMALVLVSTPDNPSLEFSSVGFNLREQQTLEQALQTIRNTENESISDKRRRLLRIAVGVAMFGVDQHELVAPDVEREVIEARFPAGRSKAAKAMAAAAVSRELAKSTGWRVGSEIDLPRALVERGEVRAGAGTERAFGHYRSGHMRMQPCGVGGKDRKLIFVAPTLVRPDLPIRQTHGYRIRGREASHVSGE